MSQGSAAIHYAWEQTVRHQDGRQAGLVKEALRRRAQKTSDEPDVQGAVADQPSTQAVPDAKQDTPLDVVTYVPSRVRPFEIFVSAQEWDGYVTELLADSFKGVIYPVGSRDRGVEELVEVPLEFVNLSVRDQIAPGSLFRLATGRLQKKRQVVQATDVYFRPAGTVPRLKIDPDEFDKFFEN